MEVVILKTIIFQKFRIALFKFLFIEHPYFLSNCFQNLLACSSITSLYCASISHSALPVLTLNRTFLFRADRYFNTFAPPLAEEEEEKTMKSLSLKINRTVGKAAAYLTFP